MAYIPAMAPRYVTIVETGAFAARAKSRMTDDERDAVINMIAADPTCGSIISGGGGIRKVRFGVARRGKRGGVRIIYYFHGWAMPVLLLTVFAKNEQDDLSDEERNRLATAAKQIARNYGV